MRFPTVEGVVRLHDRILALTGGTAGVLNVGAVDSAVHRCQWGPFYGGVDLAERAALLLRGLCQDHPFADGNKRTAFAATSAFLRTNGTRIAATPNEVVAFMLAVAQDHLGLDEIASWIRVHMAKV